MTHEIERKFLVKGDFKPYVTGSERIVQGYLSSVPERTVRVRIKGDKGFMTIKGIGNETGTTRFEWEKELLVEDVEALLRLCEPGVIEKKRYLVPEQSGLVFEVDEFYGENKGLLIAEIELPDEDHPFVRPEWLGEEVTGDTRYYNANLKQHPFTSW
jgi:adenylate cyclase